jgi:hypothetical protein
LSQISDSATKSLGPTGFLPAFEATGTFDAAGRCFLTGGLVMKIDSGLRALPLLGAAALALAVAACSQTTYGTGRSAGLQTITDFAKAASLTGDAKDPIDYSPRAPIVAPPNGAPLPAPGAGTTTTTTALAANWPNDPDAQAAAIKAQIAEANESGRKIRILPGLNTASSGPVVDQNSPENFKTTPAQIAEYKRLLALQNGTATDANGNPVRVFLSDPPPGYMKPDTNAPPVSTAAEDTATRPRLIKWPWQWFRKS